MQGPSTTTTSVSTAYPQGRVVGNQIYYGHGGWLYGHCSCCTSPYCDIRMRRLSILAVFFFLIAMMNLIFGIMLTGLIFFGFFLVLLIFISIHYWRMKSAIQFATANQPVTYSQVPQGGEGAVTIHSQAQGYPPTVQPPAPQQYTNQPHPPQSFPPHPYPNQQYPSQQYPGQPYPIQPYPLQHVPQNTQSYPPAINPSVQAATGEKQPIPEGGVPPAATGGMATSQPGMASKPPGPNSPPDNIPPPPSYDEVVNSG